VTVFVKQGGAHGAGFLGNILPRIEIELWCVLDGLPCDFLVVFIVKRQDTTEHEVCDDSERPEIYFFTVRFLKKNLGGNIR
jgi:hypothetical protein